MFLVTLRHQLTKNTVSFQECSRYMSPAEISKFLDGAIRSRISVRLIAEQHIALTHALNDPHCDRRSVGVVDMRCSPLRMVQMCGSFVTELCEATLGNSPSIKVDGEINANFAYDFMYVYARSIG
jgi:26S proteasome regulatory subunit T1